MRRLPLLAVAVALAGAPLVARADSWVDRHPIGQPVEGPFELLDATPHPALPPLLPGERYAILDGMIVVLDLSTLDLLRVAIAADALPPARPAPRDPLLLGVPRGAEPRNGLCRPWFPGRPADQQPEAGPCDMPVPPGAELIGR